MKLAPKAKCPIHNGRRDCCGRAEVHRYAQVKKSGHGIWEPIGPGRWRATDGSGRERFSKAAIRRRKDSLLRAGTLCAACGEKFSDYRDVELAHIHGKGLGGAFRDDGDRNTTLMHMKANRIQGGMDLAAYLKIWKPEHCTNG